MCSQNNFFLKNKLWSVLGICIDCWLWEVRSQRHRIWFGSGEADFTVREIRSFTRCKPFIKLHSYSPISRYSLTWCLPGNSFIEDVLSVFHSMLIKYCLWKKPFWYPRQLRIANNNLSIILIFFLLPVEVCVPYCFRMCKVRSTCYPLPSEFSGFLFPCCLWTVLQETSV